MKTDTELRCEVISYRQRLEYLEHMILRNNVHDLTRERQMIQQRNKHDEEMRNLLFKERYINEST